MEKQLTISVPNASGEEGLTLACRRGELFRNNSQIEKYYSQGYVISGYSILGENTSTTSNPQTTVNVILQRWS
jgi:hypothetical protein